MTDYASAVAPKIAGSVAKGAISSFGYNDNRAEGPLDTTGYNSGAGHGASSAMMITGSRIDAIVQDLGITEKTVLVLTGTGSGAQYDVWRTYWIFTYWGFSKAKIKVLDGGTAAFAAAFPALAPTTVTALYDPADSTFSVKKLPVLKSQVRASIKEVIDAVENGSPVIFAQATAAGSRNIKTEHSFFLGAGSVHVNGKFNDADTIKATIIANINASYAADSNTATVTTWDDVLALFAGKTIYVHCGAGFSASALYTAFVDVLGIPVVLYDGSNNQWNAFKADGPLQGLIPAYDTSLYSFSVNGGQTALVGAPGVFVDWNYTGTGNEIYEEDYEYHNATPAGNGGGGLGDSIGSGC
jgi:3-mercaptopyruvate sulfurtransferase SseA